MITTNGAVDAKAKAATLVKQAAEANEVRIEAVVYLDALVHAVENDLAPVSAVGITRDRRNPDSPTRRSGDRARLHLI